MLGEKGDKTILLIPSNKGYISDKIGLKWELRACRMTEIIVTMKFYLLTSNYGLDLLAIDERLHKLQYNEENKKSAKKTKSLERRLRVFLSQLPHSPDFTVMTP